MQRLSIFILLSLLVACQHLSQTPPPLKTQLQVRDFQTRTLTANKTDEVLSAVVEAFQDEGFMVKNVIPQIGLIVATREVDLEDSSEAFFKTFMLGQNAMWKKNAIIEATANVKNQSGKIKVRLSFQEKVLNNHGGITSIKLIEDLKFYQNFFDKIEKSIFIEKQKY